MEEKARGSFFEVSEMLYMAPLARHMIQLACLLINLMAFLILKDWDENEVNAGSESSLYDKSSLLK